MSDTTFWYGFRFNNYVYIGDKIDTQLLRLLIKADEAIRKENQVYDLYGCGSAFSDVYALSNYLVRFKLGTRRIKMPKLL